MELTSKNVFHLFVSLLFLEDELQDDEPPEEHIEIEGITQTVYFHPLRLNEAKTHISKLVSQTPLDFQEGGGGGNSFLALCYDINGEQWTDSHQHMEELCLMAVAAGVGKWSMPREMWPTLPRKMPYITFNPKGV